MINKTFDQIRPEHADFLLYVVSELICPECLKAYFIKWNELKPEQNWNKGQIGGFVSQIHVETAHVQMV